MKENQYVQTTIDTNIATSDKVKAEIVWSLFTVTRGFSNNSAKDLNATLEKMFPDSTIASEFQLGPDKLKYLTNWGLAPFIREQLKGDLDKAEYITVSFDESLNEVTQTCQMDIVLRFWDNDDQQG